MATRNAEQGVTWVHSYGQRGKRTTFCVYDAPTPEAIRTSATRNDLPVDQITEVARARPVLLRLKEEHTMRRLIVVALLTAATAAAGTALGSALPSDNPRPTLASDLAAARDAGREVRERARPGAGGYRILTRMIPDMGYHFLNPGSRASTFAGRRSSSTIAGRSGSWRARVGVPEAADDAADPGAKYGSFGAACHYVDGTFVFADSQDKCARTAPRREPSSTSGTGRS